MLDKALSLASLDEDVVTLGGSEVEMQEAAWDAAEAAVQKSIDLTKELGVRPTVALLVDPTNDYSIYLHDNTDVLSKDNFVILNNQLREAAEEFTTAA